MRRFGMLPVPAHEGESDLLKRITSDPEICNGRPCIRGMRIRVSDILDLLASGVGNEEILLDYDYLELDDIRAALLYAAGIVNHQVGQAA